MSRRQTAADGRSWLILLLAPCIPLSLVVVLTLLPGPIGVVLAIATAMLIIAAVVAVSGRGRSGQVPEDGTGGVDTLRHAEGGTRVVWLLAALGAVLQMIVLVATNVSEYEGTDVIVFLGPFAFLLGAAGGATIGVAVRNRGNRQPAQPG